MSDLYSRVETYREAVKQGALPKVAQHEVGLTDAELVAAGMLDEQYDKTVDAMMPAAETASQLVKYKYVPEGSISSGEAIAVIQDETPDDDEGHILREAHAADDKDSGWYDKPWGFTKGVWHGTVQTYDWLHQTITHKIAGRDGASAKPYYMKPTNEAGEHVDYERISMLTALNEVSFLNPIIQTVDEALSDDPGEPIAKFEGYGTDSGAKFDPLSYAMDRSQDLGSVPVYTGKGLKVGLAAIADLAVDVATNPMDWLTLYGAGSKAWNLFRRLAPAAVKAEATGQLARRTSYFGDIVEEAKSLVGLRKEVSKNLKLGKINKAEAAEMNVKIDRHAAGLESEIKLRFGGEEGEIVSHQVPARRPDTIKIPDEGTASKLEIELAEARKKALELDPPSVRAMYDDEADALRRAVEGPDHAEYAAETGAILAKGGHADDTVMLTGMPLNGTKTSTNLPPSIIDGVGTLGRINFSGLRMRGFIGQLEGVQNNLVKHADSLRKAIDDLGAVAKKAGKSAVVKHGDAPKLTKADLKKGIKEAEDQARDIQKHIAEMRKTGRVPKSLEQYDVKWPAGPRREIIDASDFATSQFGAGWNKVLRRTLYPGSYMPRPAFLVTTDRIFREHWRVLEKYAPEVMERVAGGMRDAEITYTRYAGRVGNIFAEAGIYTNVPKNGVIDSSGLGGLVEKLTINKDRSKKLFKLLDTKTGSVQRELAEDVADAALLKAADELRAVQREFVELLNLPEDQIISDYITHIMERSRSADGYVPFMMEGNGKSRGVYGILKDRKGDGGEYVEDAASAFDYYIKAASSELHIRPIAQDVRWGMADAVRTLGFDGTAAGDRLMYSAESVIDRLAGRPTWTRNVLKAMDGKGIPGATAIPASAQAISLAAYSSVLAGNPRYFVMSVSQAINSTAPGMGSLHTLKGAAKMVSPEGRMLSKMMGTTEESNRLFEGLEGVVARTVGDIRFGPVPSIRDAESYIRGVTMHASLSAQMSKLGFKTMAEVPPNVLNEIFAGALRDTRNMNHLFGWLGKPEFFSQISRSGSTFFTQFTSFPFKQTETIVNNALKNPGYFTDYLLYSGWLTKNADLMGVDLTNYVGIPDYNLIQDPESIPVAWTKAAFTAMLTYADIESLPGAKRKAMEDFKEESKNVIPFRTATLGHIDRYKALHGQPVKVRDSQGRLVRERDTGIGSGGLGASALVAVTLGMNDAQGRLAREVHEATRLADSKIDTYRMEISDRYAKAAREERPPTKEDMEVIRKLSVELSKLGDPVTVKQLADFRRGATRAQEIPAEMRSRIDEARRIPIQEEAKRKERTR